MKGKPCLQSSRATGLGAPKEFGICKGRLGLVAYLTKVAGVLRCLQMRYATLAAMTLPTTAASTITNIFHPVRRSPLSLSELFGTGKLTLRDPRKTTCPGGSGQNNLSHLLRHVTPLAGMMGLMKLHRQSKPNVMLAAQDFRGMRAKLSTEIC